MDLSVSTFRTSRIPSIKNALLEESPPSRQKDAVGINRSNSVSRSSDGRTPIKRGSILINRKRHSLIPVSKLEDRKVQRNLRMTVYKDLMKEKPDNKYEDPKDVSGIQYAQNNMGDYKLKTSDDYIVPENERIDAEKKLRQINLLTEGQLILKEVKSLNSEIAIQ